MKYDIDNVSYEVVIEKKSNRNTYVRVKDDLKIYVSTNYLISKNEVKKILDSNINSVKNMINRQKLEIEKQGLFFYLGKRYDIINVSSVNKVSIVDNKIYTKDETMLNKWLKDEIIRIFDERYIYVYNHFKENIKSPILKIRNMKTRWGVYNKKNHTITLNSKLIEYDISKIDYVIIHELSHIIHFDHSKEFWDLVNKYCPNYKIIRKEMKE